MSGPTDGAALEAELTRLADDRREAAHLRAKLAHATEALEAADALVERRRRELAQDQQEVARLESLSITRVLRSLSGSRDADLRQGRAQRDAACFAVSEAEDRRAQVFRELSQIRDRLISLGDLDARWDRVIEQRERWIEATGEPGAAEVAALAGRRGVLDAECREVDEAITAARQAAAVLAEAADEIGEAASWDGVDSWFGSGPLASPANHERIERATALLRQVDTALESLDRELADVEHATLAPLRFDTWDRAFDGLFDGLFTDLAVHTHLREAIGRLAQARVVVDRTADQLDHGRARLDVSRSELDAQRRRLLT